MEVDTAHMCESATSADSDFDSQSIPASCSAMDAEEVVQQYIREAQSPTSNSIPVLTRYVRLLSFSPWHSHHLVRTLHRFVGVLDQLDTRVERFRKEAMHLQEQRDHLLISLDLIKNNDLFANLEERE